MVQVPKLTQNKEIVPFFKIVAAIEKVQRIIAFWTVPAQLPTVMAWLPLRGGKMLSLPLEDGAGINLPWLSSGRGCISSRFKNSQ